MGVLKRFFECVDTESPRFKGCGKKWTSKAFQLEEEQCPNCLHITAYTKTYQKMRDGNLIGKYKCKGRPGKKCGRTWTSAAAFKSKWQKCSRCQSKTKPWHVIEHDYEDMTTVASSICSELQEINVNDAMNSIASRSDDLGTNGNQFGCIQEGSEILQSELPKRTQQHKQGHDMAGCELCIELAQNCVKYYEFIRNPEKEAAAKKKADKLRPMLRAKMLEEQSAHLSFIANLLGPAEQKAKIQKIHAEQPPSSGEEDDHPPRPPPARKQRYRKRKASKTKKTE